MKTTTLKAIRRNTRMVVVVSVALLSAVLALQLLPTKALAQTTLPDEILDVRFGDQGTFERAVIDVGTTGTAPLAPTFTHTYRNGDSVVRVNLPSVGQTATTDGTGLGKAISKYRVVRAPGATNNLFVDFHLTGAAKNVKVYKLENPARVVVDVTPGGVASRPKPAVGDLSVIMSPRANNLVGPGRFAVRGYARPFEAQGNWRIKNPAGRVVRQGVYQTNDWTEAWGSYSFSASYPTGLSGKRGTLEVGQFSPRDGQFTGVSVPVRFR